MADHAHPVDPGRVELARARASGAAAEPFSDLFALMGDPVRTRIVLALLAAQELCVGDLAAALDVSEDAVSYALRLLRSGGLVRSRREGRMRMYRLADETTGRAVSEMITGAASLVDPRSGGSGR